MLHHLDTLAALALVAYAVGHLARRLSLTPTQRWGARCLVAGLLIAGLAATCGEVFAAGGIGVGIRGGVVLGVAGFALWRWDVRTLWRRPVPGRVVLLGLGLAGGAATAALLRWRGPVPALPAGVGVAGMLWLSAPPVTPRARARTLVFAGLWSALWVLGPAYVQVADAGARRMTAPIPRLPATNVDAPERFGWERVRFPASDGVPLVGWWAPGPRPATVLICHGHGDEKGAFVPFIFWLRQVGWSAFVFDLRTHGESGGTVATLGVNEQRDLEAAIEIARTRQEALPGGAAAPLVVFAYSMGGTVATPVVARDPRVAALVIEGSSPYPLRNLRRAARRALGPVAPAVLPAAYGLVYARTGAWIPSLRPKDAIGRISPRPVLLVHGMRDALPVEWAREFYAAAGEPKQYFEAPNSRHVAAFFDDFPAYSRVITAFLNRLAPPPEAPAARKTDPYRRGIIFGRGGSQDPPG